MSATVVSPHYRLSANLIASTLLLAAILATWRPHQLACAENRSSEPEATRNTRQMSARAFSGPQVSVRDQSASLRTANSSGATTNSSTPFPCSITKQPVGESLEGFLKPWLSTRGERPMNATEGSAHEAARCRSNTHTIRFREPGLAQRRLKTLAAMQPGDSIDRWLFLGREPRWINECNVRIPSPIPVQVPSVKRATLEGEVANQEPILHANLVQPLDGTQAPANAIKRRSKRSAPMMIHFANNLHLASRQNHKLQDGPASSPILFRTKYSWGQTRVGAPSENKLQLAKQAALAKWLKPKKTTFSLSRWPGANQKYGQIGHSKSRFLVGGAAQVPIMSHLANHQQMNTSRMQTIFEQLHQLDYDVNRRLTELYETEKDLSDFIGKVSDERKVYLSSTGSANNVSMERRDQIKRERHLWMPPIEELVLAGEVNETSLFNMTGGLYNGQVEFVMANMTKYIELFLVAVEQMLYDQDELSDRNDYLEKKLIIYDYQDLEAKTQRLLCDAKNLLKLLAQWKALRRSFAETFTNMTQRGEALRLRESNSGEFLPKLITHTLFRDQPIPESFQHVESPLALAWARLDSSERAEKLGLLESFLPENRAAKMVDGSGQHSSNMNSTLTVRKLSYPTHFWRDVMPLEQRQLLSATERAVRDISILDDMRRFLKAYKSLIFNNVPADMNLSKLYSN